MMRECWNKEKEKRPTFSQLKLQLKALCIALKRQSCTENKNADELYIN